MTERERYLGKRLVLRKDANELKLRLSGDVTALRALLDPFTPVENIKWDVIAAQALEAADKHSQLIEKLDVIAAITREIGE